MVGAAGKGSLYIPTFTTPSPPPLSTPTRLVVLEGSQTPLPEKELRPFIPPLGSPRGQMEGGGHLHRGMLALFLITV